MKHDPHHKPSYRYQQHFQPLNLDASSDPSTSSAHTPLSRDPRDEPPPLLPPTEAIDKLLTADLARGHVATNTLDPSTLGTPLSSITLKPLTWLWPNLIPRGTLTLLDGDPGNRVSITTTSLPHTFSAGG